MLPADVLDVFEKRLAGLPRPVTIEYFQTGGSRLTVPGRVALPPCPDCRSTLELLQEVTAVSDLVSLGVHEFGHDPQLAAEYDVDRVPGIVVNGGSGRRLPLYGLPLGHFLPVLLDAMLRVAREPGEPPEEVTRILDEVDEPLQVRVVGSVRHSPATQAAIVAYTLASYFDPVQASVYAMESFPELVRDLDMTHTPLTFVNRSFGFAGVATLVGLAQYALDCQNDPDGPRPPTVAGSTIGEVAGRTAQAPARPGSGGLAVLPPLGACGAPRGALRHPRQRAGGPPPRRGPVPASRTAARPPAATGRRSRSLAADRPVCRRPWSCRARAGRSSSSTSRARRATLLPTACTAFWASKA